MPIVTLLTDFGDADGFVGAMRGVILSRAPDARLVDLAHHVPRGDVAKAGRVLARAALHFPPGAVHCVVVDPGVGSARRAIAVAAGGMGFIAPDNGVLGAALEAIEVTDARVIENPAAMRSTISHTFHGRDVFAPAAAWLAGRGIEAIADIGPPAGALVRSSVTAPRTEGDRIIGRVVEVDVYGNLITDVPAGGGVEIRLGDTVLRGPLPSYSAVPPGALVLVAGSLGTLEVAVRDGSAAARLGLGAGAACVVRPTSAESGA